MNPVKNQKPDPKTDPITHKGGCHCGAVRFELIAPQKVEIIECNCSVCSMSAYEHVIIPKADFTLLQGEQVLTSYQFHTKTAKHLFCASCGIKSFYHPRSHPESVSVNYRCVEPGTVSILKRTPFDGREWKKNIHKLNQDKV